MSEIQIKSSVKVVADCDVLVVGGGPAGLCAAIAAARQGVKVVLAERYGYCGGMATAGLVGPFMTCYDAEGKQMLIQGVFSDLVDRLVKEGGAIHPSQVPTASSFTSYIGPGHLHVTPFDPEILKRVADDMLTEAGVDVRYHVQFIEPVMDGKRVAGAIFAAKGGLEAVTAKQVVDCTGDGDVCFKSGAPMLIGSDGKGKMQPATMFFRIGNVDLAKVDQDIKEHLHMFYRKDGVNYRSFHWRVSEARENGDWDLDRVSIGMFRGVKEDEWSINTSRVMHVDGTDSKSLTRGEMEGRKQVETIFNFLRKYVPGCENAKLLSVAPQIGIRETRHLLGQDTLRLDDVLGAVIPEDAILLCANSVDVHGKFGPKSNQYIPIEPGKHYGVPYGALVPQEIEGLIAAGRFISAEPDASGAIRVMPPCMGIGQAAGTAAAMCVKKNIQPAAVDAQELREVLTQNGAYLG